MRKYNSKLNENGFAATLTVFMLSAALIFSLTMVYTYINNQIRYHARIKEAYKIINVTEEAAKIARSYYDTVQATGGPVTLPTPDTTGCPGGMTYNIVIPNVDNPNLPYCFALNTSGGGAIAMRTNAVPEEDLAPRYFAVLDRLDRFFDAEYLRTMTSHHSASLAEGADIGVYFVKRPTLLGWILPAGLSAPRVALAGGVSEPADDSSGPFGPYQEPTPSPTPSYSSGPPPQDDFATNGAQCGYNVAEWCACGALPASDSRCSVCSNCSEGGCPSSCYETQSASQRTAAQRYSSQSSGPPPTNVVAANSSPIPAQIAECRPTATGAIAITDPRCAHSCDGVTIDAGFTRPRSCMTLQVCAGSMGCAPSTNPASIGHLQAHIVTTNN